MMKRVLILAALFSAGLAVFATTASAGRGPHPRPVVYVESHGLYYDSIVTADPLPNHGPFQLLVMGPNGLTTEYGPGDRGYVGGRWMEDFDGDGEFHYFLCPLLGKGRENP